MCWICSYGRLLSSILLIFIFSISNSFTYNKFELNVKSDLLELSRKYLIQQVNTIEANNRNDGQVSKYLKSVGLSPGYPYCAAGQYWCFKMACDQLKMPYSEIPILRSALANQIFNHAAINGTKTKYIAQKDDLIVWIKYNTPFGHIERISSVSKAGWVITVAFNVKNNKKEGVFYKKRNIYAPISRMKIRGLIGFKTK